jgi:sugar lactone lactonase YvrE
VSSLITAVEPAWALPGARVAIHGSHFPLPAEGPPHVLINGADARVVGASPRTIRVLVPTDVETGPATVSIDELPGMSGHFDIGRVLATDVHQVDSPAFDRSGRLYATHSGGRDTKVPVPLHRFTREGIRQSLAVEIANPTSLALGPDGAMYISSRFDSNVYRLTMDDRAELYVTEVGVPTGLAFAPDGTLFIGDRSGAILRVSPDRQVDTYATLPASVAAFHLAYGPDSCLYVTAPTLSTHDAIYRITGDRTITTVSDAFGRPQGLAFDPSGALFVVDALAGNAGLYRLDLGVPGARPKLVLSAVSLVGVAFDPAGGVVLASNDTIWKLDVDSSRLTGSPKPASHRRH